MLHESVNHTIFQVAAPGGCVAFRCTTHSEISNSETLVASGTIFAIGGAFSRVLAALKNPGLSAEGSQATSTFIASRDKASVCVLLRVDDQPHMQLGTPVLLPATFESGRSSHKTMMSGVVSGNADGLEMILEVPEGVVNMVRGGQSAFSVTIAMPDRRNTTAFIIDQDAIEAISLAQ